MLVAAFSGLDAMRAAYAVAIDRRFRFFSYGDACLLERAGLKGGVSGPRFELLARRRAARRGRLPPPSAPSRPRPFMPVGTAATVKAVTFDMVRQTGAEIVLCNTYHLDAPPRRRAGRPAGRAATRSCAGTARS
jgi:hypothetical protein